MSAMEGFRFLRASPELFVTLRRLSGALALVCVTVGVAPISGLVSRGQIFLAALHVDQGPIEPGLRHQLNGLHRENSCNGPKRAPSVTPNLLQPVDLTAATRHSQILQLRERNRRECPIG